MAANQKPLKIGQIEVRGPNVFQGYWQMPEKTAEELRADGFFITGDLGVKTEDGRVSIVGRQKDLIISGGYNIYPKEIEDVINDVDAREAEARLRKATGEQKPPAFVKRKTPRRLKHFSTDTNVSFREDPDGGGTVVHLTCHDRPGLLSRVAAAFTRQGLQVPSARIATFGEKVEDTFLLSDRAHRPLSEEAMEALRENICKFLE